MTRDAAKRKPLGRGLSALLGEAPSLPPEPAPAAAGGLRTLPIGPPRPGRFQPRRRLDAEAMRSLVESIREKGIVQPSLVRPHETEGWEIIAGERRWRAAQAAGLHDVPVVVQPLDDRA